MLVCKPWVALMGFLKFEKAVTIFSNFMNYKKKHTVYKLRRDSFWLSPTVLNCAKWSYWNQNQLEQWSEKWNHVVSIYVFIAALNIQLDSK